MQAITMKAITHLKQKRFKKQLVFTLTYLIISYKKHIEKI